VKSKEGGPVVEGGDVKSPQRDGGKKSDLSFCLLWFFGPKGKNSLVCSLSLYRALALDVFFNQLFGLVVVVVVVVALVRSEKW
jgi:hypothetical protein